MALEEGKHDFFRRYLEQVIREDSLVTPPEAGRRLYDVELPEAMGRLMTDPSPVAHARALTTYGPIVEAMLADTGQQVLEEALEPRDILPGLRAGLLLVNRDESRHVAYGFHVLKRLIESDARVAPAVKARVQELAPLVTALADAVIMRYESRPFSASRMRSVGRSSGCSRCWSGWGRPSPPSNWPSPPSKEKGPLAEPFHPATALD